ncbi:hypothetical protein D3OALGB2SA_3604 [Olavius algarvensis associated proteobacterium Delta 3]|nr:hypothetical protein D3OALGB2SA_3604 [Olavius algarvensis associated proteobacterium Delta 3]
MSLKGQTVKICIPAVNSRISRHYPVSRILTHHMFGSI